jgi:hypothetical protein
MDFRELMVEQDKIIKAFPKHFKKCIDLGCREEWLPIITDLVTFVDALMKQDAYEHEFHWLQIKQKFGQLRAYYSFSGPEEIRKLIDDAIGVAEVKIERLSTTQL